MKLLPALLVLGAGVRKHSMQAWSASIAIQHQKLMALSQRRGHQYTAAQSRPDEHGMQNLRTGKKAFEHLQGFSLSQAKPGSCKRMLDIIGVV